MSTFQEDLYPETPKTIASRKLECIRNLRKNSDFNSYYVPSLEKLIKEKNDELMNCQDNDDKKLRKIHTELRILLKVSKLLDDDAASYTKTMKAK